MNLLVLLTTCLLACSSVSALSCLPCDRNTCTTPTCPGGQTVTDQCGCCKVCAKLDGEVCGGPWKTSGECASGLECVTDRKIEPGMFNQEVGVCKGVFKILPSIDTTATDDVKCEKAVVQCFMSPCGVARCPGVPGATCRDNFCGSCSADWYKDNQKLTTAQCDGTVDTSVACQHNGVTYQSDERFKVDCNTCICNNGKARCTKKKCFKTPTTKLKPEAEGCRYNGQVYKSGTSFKQECNNCFCRNGKAICTKMGCFKTATMKPTPAPKVCTHQGKEYKAGQSFHDGCNRCFCGSGGMAACTQMACLDRLDRLPKLGVESGCFHNGKHQSVGTFKDDCNTCRCGDNGQVSCTKMGCQTGMGSIFDLLDLKQNCTHDSQMYAPGQRFSKGCNSCTCHLGGRIGCTRTRGCFIARGWSVNCGYRGRGCRRNNRTSSLPSNMPGNTRNTGPANLPTRLIGQSLFRWIRDN